MTPEHFIVVGAGIIEKEGKILFVKEGKKVARGLWNFPAGSMEPFENPEKCAVREVEEETGLEVKPEYLVGIYIDTSEDGKEKVINFVYKMKVIGGKPEVKTEDTVKDLSWFDPSKVRELSLRAEYIKSAVRDFKNKQRTSTDILTDLTKK